MALAPGHRRFLHTLALVLFGCGVVASVFLYSKVREWNVLLDQLVTTSTRGIPRADVDSTVLAMSRAIFRRTNHVVVADQLPLYDRLEATSFFNVGSSVALKHGIYGIEGFAILGPCGTMSRVLLNACWRAGIPARKLQILPDPADSVEQHTMVEFRNGNRWQVISPSDDSFVWRTREGRIATLEEIRADSTIFDQIYSVVSYYHYHFRRTSNIRWAKLPRPVRHFFRFVLGPERYAKALTPKLYDEPRLLLLILACGATLLAGVLALMLRPRRPA